MAWKCKRWKLMSLWMWLKGSSEIIWINYNDIIMNESGGEKFAIKNIRSRSKESQPTSLPHNSKFLTFFDIINESSSSFSINLHYVKWNLQISLNALNDDWRRRATWNDFCYRQLNLIGFLHWIELESWLPLQVSTCSHTL